MPTRYIEAVFASPSGRVVKSIPYAVVLGHTALGNIARVFHQFPDWVIPVFFDHLLLPQALYLVYYLPNISFIHYSLQPSEFILLLLDVIEYLIQLSLVMWKSWRFNNRCDLIVVG